MTDFVVADTEYGRVKGIRKTSVLNDDYIAFLGLPYASPPLGLLRFKVSFVRSVDSLNDCYICCKDKPLCQLNEKNCNLLTIFCTFLFI
jgi:carboxylesterase type B